MSGAVLVNRGKGDTVGAWVKALRSARRPTEADEVVRAAEAENMPLSARTNLKATGLGLTPTDIDSVIRSVTFAQPVDGARVPVWIPGIVLSLFVWWMLAVLLGLFR